MKTMEQKVQDHEKRLLVIEALVGKFQGIDGPTIERCLSTAHNAIDEIVNALEATASLVLTDESRNQANAARMMKCKLREFEAVLAPPDPFSHGRRVWHAIKGMYGDVVEAPHDSPKPVNCVHVKFDNDAPVHCLPRYQLTPVGKAVSHA